MLENRTIIVTGGAQGIGRALSDRILAHGGRPIALDIDDAMLADAASAFGDKGHTYRCNVADEAEVDATFARIFAELGPVSGLINNAGILRPALTHKMALKDWDAVMSVNLTGTFLCTRAVTGHMVERAKAGETDPGCIVNVSAIAGRKGAFGQINYAAAKAGMLGCTMTTAREYAKYNIRANSVCFGLVETRATERVRSDPDLQKFLTSIPLGRVAKTDDVVEPVLFLMSAGAGYVTGQHLNVDGGSAMGY